MRVMKVNCTECGAKAIISKTNRKDPKLSDLYCQCSDVECGHTFVMNLTFSHTISPSARSGRGLVKSLLSLLRPEDKQIALTLLQENLY
ncbi:ogr/Delta-like zinc finger family protein [Serratia sp. TSA_198.1]|uniref:ogr/Delta-like zinc finger family protein n=1 Tax=Serratia sp. TSA_198.1 TaxID=3415664 RepID=UPI004045C2C5